MRDQVARIHQTEHADAHRSKLSAVRLISRIDGVLALRLECSAAFQTSRLVLAFAACCAVASCVAPISSGGPRLGVGFLDDQAFRWGSNRQANLELAHRQGATLVRVIVE